MIRSSTTLPKKTPPKVAAENAGAPSTSTATTTTATTSTTAPSTTTHGVGNKVDVSATASEIVERGKNELHETNAANAKPVDVGHGGKDLKDAPVMARFKGVDRTARMNARGTKALSAAELESAAQKTFLPLASLLLGHGAVGGVGGGVGVGGVGVGVGVGVGGGGVGAKSSGVDDKRWNEPTWKAFQLASTLEPAQRDALLGALAQGATTSAPADLPGAVAAALAKPGVSRETLAMLLSAKKTLADVVTADLPTISKEDAAALLRVVHDEGYAKAQAARIASPTSLLCGADAGAGIELLDERRAALLPLDVRARLVPAARAHGAGGEASMPRITLADLVRGPKGVDGALAFMTSSGKDVKAPMAELDGASVAQFLAKRPGESDDAYAKRLASKQVFNSFARPWDTLVGEAVALGGDKQLAFLEKKQESALAPNLLLVATPALFSRATDPSTSRDTLDALMQIAWRVSNPHLSFSDPLVHDGIGALRKTHGEELAKDKHLADTVIHAEKTRVLSGLRDDTYDTRLKGLLSDRGIPVKTDLVAQALGRLLRDVGVDNPQLEKALAEMKLDGPEGDVIAKLHALRLDPRMFPLENVDAKKPAHAGTLPFTWTAPPGGGGQILPEVVGATTVAFRVTLQKPHGGFATGESVLLRFPKGAGVVVGGDGNVSLHVHDPKRFAETSARLGDFEVIERRVRTTDNAIVDVGGGHSVLVEGRKKTSSAAEQLKRGAQITADDVAALADQYVRGLCDVDETTHPHGLFYELGPDNYVLDGKGIVGSYVDVALMFRTERERGEFGFFQGGYSSAANWIVGDNTPLTPAQVKDIWSSSSLSAEQQARRAMFKQALDERLQPDHPAYQGVSPDVRDATIASLTRDAEVLASSPNPPPTR